MKLASFKVGDRKSLGIVVEEQKLVVDLEANFEKFRKSLGKPSSREAFRDLKKFIEHGAEAMEIAEEIAEKAREGRVREGIYPLKDVKILPPIANPSKIICTGLNFEDYRKILGLEYLPVPQIFLKAPSAIIGHMDPIEVPLKYGEVYHEWELACIIGKRCRNVEEADAEEYIFGYTILNDITAHDIELMTRELQLRPVL